jgi:hypothetical protein
MTGNYDAMWYIAPGVSYPGVPASTVPRVCAGAGASVNPPYECRIWFGRCVTQ